MPSLEKRLKRVYIGTRLRARYGVSRPGRVRLAHSDHWIHLDPGDERAWALIAGRAVRGICPRNQRFWREACASLQPGLALDIGANFGECVISGVYAPGTAVIAYEPNEAIVPYLERSRAEHPQGAQIRIVSALVGEAAGQTAFYVDLESSGASSAAPPPEGADTGRYQRRVARTVSIDESVREAVGGPAASVVFKIDVEGYEMRVLAGARRTLDAAEHALGLMEFDSRYIARAGHDPEAALRELQGRFEVYAFRRDDALVPAQRVALAELRKRPGKDHVHTDLLLLKAPAGSPARALVEAWMARTPGRTEPPRAAAV